MSILMVEDEAALRDIVVDLLEDEGMTCHVAATIAQAIDMVQRYQPTLILLDQHLPDGGGLENVPRVRAMSKHPVSIIIFSAGRLSEEEVIAAGADGLLAKPFGLDELLAIIKQYGDGPPSSAASLS